jgi:hypothetical protein
MHSLQSRASIAIALVPLQRCCAILQQRTFATLMLSHGATLCTTCDREFSLHLLMIRPFWCIHMFHTGRRPHNGGGAKFLLRGAMTV